MRLSDPGQHDEPDARWVAAGPAILASVIMVLCFAATLLLMNLDALRPKVGDMVVYRPQTAQQDIWQLQVNSTDGQRICLMDPAVMTIDGGSLMIEGRDDTDRARQYRLHWAGAHTARGTGDCPGSADVVVSRADLQKLANAAGGFGIQHGAFVR